MFTLLTLTTLYFLILIGAGGTWVENQRKWPRAAQGLLATGNLISATPWLKSVNWNGGDGKKSGGK